MQVNKKYCQNGGSDNTGEDIDLDEKLLVTLESVSEFNIFESKEVVVPDDLFENEDLEDSTQSFDLEAATNLPELLFVDETTIIVPSKIICNKCDKIFQRTDIYQKHERMCGKFKFSTTRYNLIQRFNF